MGRSTALTSDKLQKLSSQTPSSEVFAVSIDQDVIYSISQIKAVICVYEFKELLQYTSCVYELDRLHW